MVNHSYDRFKDLLFVSPHSTLADCNSVAWQIWSEDVVGVVFRPENEKEGIKCPNEDTVSNQK